MYLESHGSVTKIRKRAAAALCLPTGLDALAEEIVVDDLDQLRRELEADCGRYLPSVPVSNAVTFPLAVNW